MAFRFKSISLAAAVATAAVFSGATIPVGARAASFDCAKAQTPTETMICDKPELSRMDDRLGQLFRQVRSDRRLSANARENILADQRAWLGRANGCTDTGCLEALYAIRIDQLQEQQRDIAGGATDGEAEAATAAPELLGDPQHGRTVGTENPETSTPAIVVPADLPQLSLQTLNLIAGAILVGGVFLAIAGPMSAGHIHRRFAVHMLMLEGVSDPDVRVFVMSLANVDLPNLNLRVPEGLEGGRESGLFVDLTSNQPGWMRASIYLSCDV